MEVRALGGEDAPAEGNGNLLQHSCLENSMDRGDWRATVYGLTRVRHNQVTEQTHTAHLNTISSKMY